MRCQNDRRPRSGNGEYCRFGDNSSSDSQVYSSSSGGSSRPVRSNRPIIRPSSNPVSHVRTPEQHNAGRNRADSPMVLEAPGIGRSASTLHGYQTSDTYKSRLSTTTNSPKQSSPIPSAATTTTNNNNNARQHHKAQYISSRLLTSNAGSHWALEQELKLKLVGIPKRHWTNDIYFAMSEFGTVMKIDIQIGSRDNIAWVIFQ